MTPFDRALERTLGFEGGYANVKQDRGGPTNYGVTQKAYDAWRTTTGQEKRPVDAITDEEVKALYLADYWLPCRCDDLPERLAIAVFDMAVNSGPWNAKRTLQAALRVKVDGVVGPSTVKAAQEADDTIVLRFLKRRAGFIQEVLYTHPTDVCFIEGWINRLLDQAWRPQ